MKEEILKNAIEMFKPDFYEKDNCPECGDYMEKDQETGTIKCVYCEYEKKEA